MKGLARLGDKTFGTCSEHPTPIEVGGTIISTSGDTSSNSRTLARLGDTVQADCGHTSVIITASGTNESNTHNGVARLGDLVGSGPYSATIITASGDIFTG